MDYPTRSWSSIENPVVSQGRLANIEDIRTMLVPFWEDCFPSSGICFQESLTIGGLAWPLGLLQQGQVAALELSGAIAVLGGAH